MIGRKSGLRSRAADQCAGMPHGDAGDRYSGAPRAMHRGQAAAIEEILRAEKKRGRGNGGRHQQDAVA